MLSASYKSPSPAPPLLAHLWVKAVSLGTLSEITDSGSRNEIKEEIGCISIRGVSLELNTHITQKHHWLLLSATSDHHFFIHTCTQTHMHHTHAHTHTPLFNSTQPIPLFQLIQGNTWNKVRWHKFPEAVFNASQVLLGKISENSINSFILICCCYCYWFGVFFFVFCFFNKNDDNTFISTGREKKKSG